MKKILGTVLVLVTALVLVACGGSKEEKFVVGFNVDGGTPTIASQEVKKGAFAVEPTQVITKEGFTFEHWMIGTTEFVFETTAIVADTQLKAKWTPVTPGVTNYTVTFNSDGGSAVTAATVASGAKVAAPTAPTKAGFTFKHWALGEVAYNFDTAVTANITLKAIWEEAVVPGTSETVSFKQTGANGSLVFDENNAAFVGLDPAIFEVLTNQYGSYNQKIGYFTDVLKIYSAPNDEGSNVLTVKIGDAYEITKVVIVFAATTRPGSTATFTLGSAVEQLSEATVAGETFTSTAVGNQFTLANTFKGAKPSAGNPQIFITDITITYRTK